MSGPDSASRGMSGPPAIDIGWNTSPIGVRSPSVIVDVFATTPTIVHQGGVGSLEFGGVLDRTRRPIGSWPGKYPSAIALFTTILFSWRSMSARVRLRPRSSGVRNTSV